MRLYEGIAIWDGESFNLSTSTGAERIRGARVTHDLGRVLGLRPLVGRDFLPEEDKPNGPPAVLITEGVWRERFAGRSDVVGQTLKLDGVVPTIVGAVLAAALALGGAYGVASYLVTQRTREIGIRVALGARTGDIVRTVVGRGLAVVVAGIAAGVAASFGAARRLADLLFGAGSRDPAIVAAVASALLVTALVANWLPARRAARLDPMRSLRID